MTRERTIYGLDGEGPVAVYRDGELVYSREDRGPAKERQDRHYVMPDIKPYRSMIDGRIIHSRSQHREHLRDHGMVEVGNDSSLQRTEKRPIQPPKGLKETIARLVYEKLRY